MMNELENMIIGKVDGKKAKERLKYLAAREIASLAQSR